MKTQGGFIKMIGVVLLLFVFSCKSSNDAKSNSKSTHAKTRPVGSWHRL